MTLPLFLQSKRHYLINKTWLTNKKMLMTQKNQKTSRVINNNPQCVCFRAVYQ